MCSDDITTVCRIPCSGFSRTRLSPLRADVRLLSHQPPPSGRTFDTAHRAKPAPRKRGRISSWQDCFLKNHGWKTLVRTGSGLTRSGKVSAGSRKWKHCLRKVFGESRKWKHCLRKVFGESRKWKHCIRKFFFETLPAGTGLEKSWPSRVSGNTVPKKSFPVHFRAEPARKSPVRTVFVKSSPGWPMLYAKLARSCANAASQRTVSRQTMFRDGDSLGTNRSGDDLSNTQPRLPPTGSPPAVNKLSEIVVDIIDCCAYSEHRLLFRDLS